MRRVKKTTNEQFDLLKAEMALHPAAARGYGVGAQRAVVDAEWKDIVDKLNALGPPERTMTEWKKVWSDVRLRIKKQSLKKAKKNKTHKKEKPHPEEDQLMEALNSSISIYGTNIKTELNEHNQEVAATQDNHESYEQFEAAQEHKVIDNNMFYKILDATTPYQNDMEQTISTVQHQLETQEKLMTQLLKVTTNMSALMARHLKAVEKKNSLMERQLKLSENHNAFLRRQATRRKFKVWSDLRLRSIKRLSDEFTPKPKNAESIYASYGDNNEHNSYLSPTNYHDESQNEADESYDNPLEAAEEDELHNTEKHFFNSSHEVNNSYDNNSLEEKPNEVYHQTNSNSYHSERLSPHDAVQVQLSQEKMNYLGQTLNSLEQQMKNQNKIMEHLTKITSNLAELMERHVTGLEKQNTIMERQLKATKCHNSFLRRQEASRRKIRIMMSNRQRNKESCKRWREKLKEDETKFHSNRLKNNERMRIHRQLLKDMAKGNDDLIEEKRRYDRLRKRRYREKLAKMRIAKQAMDDSSGPPNYKRTTDKQYSLLKHKMAILTNQMKNANNVGSYKKHNIYWEELTQSLNKLGPPYRTLQQWKKVWSDFRRAENRRKFKSKSVSNTQYDKPDNSYNNSEEEAEESTEYRYESVPSSELKQTIKQKMRTIMVGITTNQCKPLLLMNMTMSIPIRMQNLEESYADDTQLFIPEETSCNSISYGQSNVKQPTAQQQIPFQQPRNIQFPNPPPLQPSNARILDQTFFTLQNQMEHQTKLLEHLSQMSSTMANLMERQVLAIEKQTEAIKRQASATEYHTRTMNNFIDMIRDKMLKGSSSQKAASSTANLANNIL
ncbi:LOW QUALITY PROTEIN: rac guanine nucleotide exchange factor JJ-like [Lucilia sericata]|uniref:LOW QUALITY PROTEIN: rac guanine nucleotide exchange factor JJ-like n=1 Tax=Lucilia sericata TaxID=13632 RepID=UPI0018A86BA9|nr:LOW QUALITY PROTEIN: rac guanine nucleotide exchange factor JJ-like [Lucilia sericata]